MSKKNKNKFKKQLQAKVLNEVNSANQTAVNENKPKASEIINKSRPNEMAIPEVQNLPLIKADLIKTGIVIALLALIILVLAILDSKYQILLKTGDYLFKSLNIN